MILTIDKTHELKGNGYLLGVDGENGSEQLIIKIENEALLDKWVYIEFEKDNGEKFTTERLSVVGGQIVYDIVNGLLPQGHVKVQVIFRDASGFVWKSFVRQFAVDKALNASDILPIEYPDFIGEAQKILDEISVESEKVDEVLESEEARKTAETARESAEAERTEKETARAEAEEKRANAEAVRQANETSRVNAEQTRTAQFSAWSNYEGDAPEILANLETVAEWKLFDSVLDKTTAHTKATPSGSLPYAKLLKVGGMSYKADNALIDTPVKSINGYLIPEAVQALDGYGKGLNENCYNFIDFECKKFIKKVGTLVITGEENFYIQTFGSGLTGIGIKAEIGSKASKTYINSCGYTNLKDYSAQNNLLITETAVYIVDANFQTIDAMRERLRSLYANGTPLTITYKLDAVVETDISQYINKSYIPANGSVVFENDNGQAVPSEITFFVKK